MWTWSSHSVVFLQYPYITILIWQPRGTPSWPYCSARKAPCYFGGYAGCFKVPKVDSVRCTALDASVVCKRLFLHQTQVEELPFRAFSYNAPAAFSLPLFWTKRLTRHAIVIVRWRDKNSNLLNNDRCRLRWLIGKVDFHYPTLRHKPCSNVGLFSF